MIQTNTQESLGSLADRVRWLVNAFFGGSVRAACKAIGIPQPTLHHIITGHVANPRSDVLQRIATFFDGVSVDWLITGRGPAPFAQILGKLNQETGNEIGRDVLLSFGLLQWLKFLSGFGLSEAALEAWTLAPMSVLQVERAFVDTALLLQPSPQGGGSEQLPTFKIKAMDLACRAWVVTFQDLVRRFGAQAIGERMERLTGDAWLGLNTLACRIVRGEKTAESAKLVFQTPLPVLTAADLVSGSTNPSGSGRTAAPVSTDRGTVGERTAEPKRPRGTAAKRSKRVGHRA